MWVNIQRITGMAHCANVVWPDLDNLLLKMKVLRRGRTMELGFETIGNATLICHDRRPVLVTDPWIKGSAYFGSWGLSHQIPDEQMHSIERVRLFGDDGQVM